MGILKWLVQNEFSLVNTAAILAGLLFTAFSVRAETRARRITNLLIVTQGHRDIWEQTFRRPELWRVIETSIDLDRQPITRSEDLFVMLLILHLSSAFHASKDSVFVKQEGLRQDIAEFFALPIPRTVWEVLKAKQDIKFVQFVEACLQDDSRPGHLAASGAGTD